MAKTAIQGLILPESSAFNYVMDYNRNSQGRSVLRDAIISAQASGQRMANEQIVNYSQAMNDAYVASLSNQRAILSSNLGAGAKDELIQKQTAALYDAYDAQQANLSSALDTISQSVNKTQQNVYDYAAGAATNLSGTFNEVLNYIYELNERGQSGVLNRYYSDLYVDRPVYDETEGKYKYELDEKGNVKTDEKGNPIYSTEKGLVTREELAGMISTYDPETGNITLNERGLDLMDRVLNTAATLEAGDLGFGEYLAETNPDLYAWLVGGENMGMFKEMMGLDKNDNTYNFSERLGGWSESELNTYVNELLHTADLDDIEIKDGQTVNQSKKDAEELHKYVDVVKSMATKLGVSDEYEDIIKELEEKIVAEGNRLTGAELLKELGGLPVNTESNTNVVYENRVAAIKNLNDIKEIYKQIAKDMINTALQKRKQKEVQFNSLY